IHTLRIASVVAREEGMDVKRNVTRTLFAVMSASSIVALVVGTAIASPVMRSSPTPTPAPKPTATPTPQPGPICAWRIVASPNGTLASRLWAVVAIATNDVWAVGETDGHALTEHWNGSAWSIVPAPYPTGNGVQSALRAVAAASTNDVWAVGH